MAYRVNIHLLSDIRKDVRMALDQNQAEQGVLSGNRDTLELDDLIEQKVVHAARLILENAPLRMIFAGHTTYQNDTRDFIAGTIEPTEQTTHGGIMVTAYRSTVEPQHIARPDDFLRLIKAEVVEGTDWAEDPDLAANREVWDIPLSTFGLTTDENFKTVKSKFPGIRPNAHRPALYLDVMDGMFLFYGCSYGHPKLSYIKTPRIITESESGTALANAYMQFPDVLYDALVYQTAALVETAYKNAPAAQMLSGIARGYMGIQEETNTNNKPTKQ